MINVSNYEVDGMQKSEAPNGIDHALPTAHGRMFPHKPVTVIFFGSVMVWVWVHFWQKYRFHSSFQFDTWLTEREREKKKVTAGCFDLHL